MLTPIEREIASLLARGHSVKEIARGLALSPRTVERHIDACRSKLGARNNAQLVANAIHSGQITAGRSSA